MVSLTDLLLRQATNNHIDVGYGFDFINIKKLNPGIHQTINIVQETNGIHRSGTHGDVSKVGDICKARVGLCHILH